MTDSQQTDLRLLQIRNAIADKEFTIALANRETAHFGNWNNDWTVPIGQHQQEIETLIEKVRRGE